MEAKVEFTLEADVALKESPTSDRTKKEYTAKLNALAKLGLALNRADIKKKHKAIIAHIEGLYDDDERGRFNKRFIIYAIFWSCDAKYLKTKNKYYMYLQKIPPIKNSVTGADWVPLKKYKAEQAKIEDAAPA